MACLYGYTDLDDGIIKYVGIIWSDKRTLSERINEHKEEPGFKDRRWKVEYLARNIHTRTDAECLEAHYISLYHTDEFLNRSKSGWGLCSFYQRMKGILRSS